MSSTAAIDYEAVVIGAGVCGIYQIKFSYAKKGYL